MNTPDFGLAIYVKHHLTDDLSDAFTTSGGGVERTLEDACGSSSSRAAAPDPSDRRWWGPANPSYPHRTDRSLLRLRATSPDRTTGKASASARGERWGGVIPKGVVDPAGSDDVALTDP